MKLEQLSFLESSIEKRVLTPKLQEFVDKDIDSASKQKHMDLISSFYLVILKEFYQVNSGTLVEADLSPIGNKSTFTNSFKRMPMHTKN